ncbi:hypothetical protein B7486_29460 [cyanobacterium TDX16]|nr:hypothetical protein B7486_29460 [cyanobacterium TDX16]
MLTDFIKMESRRKKERSIAIYQDETALCNFPQPISKILKLIELKIYFYLGIYIARKTSSEM